MNAATHTLGGGLRRPPTATLAGWIIIPVLGLLAALFVADRLYNPAQFRIEVIEVHGRLSPGHGHGDSGGDGGGEQIKAVVAQSLSGNYFSLSLPGIEARVEALPWVFSASVRRQWPATLVVEVVEVQPVAKWGRHHWLHFTGALVAREAGSESGSDAASVNQDLPQLSGPEHQQKTVWEAFRRWSGMFAAHGLRLDELRLDARELWHLRLTLGALALPRTVPSATSAQKSPPAPVALIVPRENAEARITQFIGALQHPLMAEFSAMRTIDLRHPNGFAVGWKTGPGN